MEFITPRRQWSSILNSTRSPEWPQTFGTYGLLLMFVILSSALFVTGILESLRIAHLVVFQTSCWTGRNPCCSSSVLDFQAALGIYASRVSLSLFHLQHVPRLRNMYALLSEQYHGLTFYNSGMTVIPMQRKGFAWL